jgi:hypothetical protein
MYRIDKFGLIAALAVALSTAIANAKCDEGCAIQADLKTKAEAQRLPQHPGPHRKPYDQWSAVYGGWGYAPERQVPDGDVPEYNHEYGPTSYTYIGPNGSAFFIARDSCYFEMSVDHSADQYFAADPAACGIDASGNALARSWAESQKLAGRPGHMPGPHKRPYNNWSSVFGGWGVGEMLPLDSPLFKEDRYFYYVSPNPNKSFSFFHAGGHCLFEADVRSGDLYRADPAACGVDSSLPEKW